jgi:hypothetical protein
LVLSGNSAFSREKTFSSDIIFILADDLGYIDVNFYAQKD